MFWTSLNCNVLLLANFPLAELFLCDIVFGKAFKLDDAGNVLEDKLSWRGLLSELNTLDLG